MMRHILFLYDKDEIMFHKNPCTENVSRCDSPNLCNVSNLHSDTRNGASKLYTQSEKKLEKIEKLSKNDVIEILERKKLELSYVSEHINSAMKNFDNIVVSQGEDSAPAVHMAKKIEQFTQLMTKIEDDITFLEVRLSELS